MDLDFDNPRLATAIHAALHEMHRDSAAESPLRTLLLYRVIQRNMALRNDRQIVNRLLMDGIDALEEADPRHAQVLRLRFVENLPVHVAANKLHIADSTLYAWQRAAIDHLVESIRRRELQAREQVRSRLMGRLPLAYAAQLIGVEPLLQQLLELVQEPRPPWIISIHGIGGIGKTALANALLSRVVEAGRFEEVGWVTAQPAQLNLAGDIRPKEQPAPTTQNLMRQLALQLMPELAKAADLTDEQLLARLEQRLADIPHLIVVDNLETVVDLEALVLTLKQLVAPTKFVLTTRESLVGEGDVYLVPMAQLDRTHALELIRRESVHSNLLQVAGESDDLLQTIYQVVGGNPLALRLVVGQLHIYDLPDILADLRAAQGMAVENLYTFIYRRAWDRLDESSRHTLLAMPLLRPEGDTLGFLGEITRLPPDELRSSIQTLARLNLVEVAGDLHRRLYSIHSLTRTFLLEQVIKWM